MILSIKGQDIPVQYWVFPMNCKKSWFSLADYFKKILKGALIKTIIDSCTYLRENDEGIYKLNWVLFSWGWLDH